MASTTDTVESSSGIGENESTGSFGRSSGQLILIVSKISGPGKQITLSDLFYMFNINANLDENMQGTFLHVTDIYYSNANFALIKFNSEEAARKAKNALDCSWMFDKFISVRWGCRDDEQMFPSMVPLAERVRLETGNADNEMFDMHMLDMYRAQQPSERTRHLMPGCLDSATSANLEYIKKYSGDGITEAEREVERDRAPPSPVLKITGLEDYEGRILTRNDLIHLFSLYGQVMDVDVGFYYAVELEENQITAHRALVQMMSTEQATLAMNYLDFTWQMGRMLKVTYSNRQNIVYSRDEIIEARERRFLSRCEPKLAELARSRRNFGNTMMFNDDGTGAQRMGNFSDSEVYDSCSE